MYQSKFNKLFKQIISENKIILENGKYDASIDIPRPNRMKTPQNYYGSTGRNARDYELYIQDEAEAVFQDKYGREKGTRALEGIIGVGNAMWKACDQILGERTSMESDLYDFFEKHPEIKQQCTDSDRFINRGFYEGSYIVDWVWWILAQIIDGKHFTNSYIQGCYPTFIGVLKLAPITTTILLKYANIDIEKPLIKPKSEKIQQPIVTQPEINIHDTTNIIQQPDPITNQTDINNFQLTGDKDHDRIIGILEKSRINKNLPVSLDNIDQNHAIQLASVMNSKITGEDKRNRRKQACLDLGLTWLSQYFTK